MSAATLNGSRSEIAAEHPLFPSDLSELQEPVKRLYCVGEVGLLALPSLAIVGARKASPYGQSCAHRFARRAAQAGLVVVSGGAIGCDQAAHRGALEAGGKTIVVLGCGANVVYPARGRVLFEEVLATGGLIISEAPWDTPPLRWAFRKRNRIIAALAHATLIVEAGLPSGTFSTADYTLAQGKDVLAVPGSIDSRESHGSNRLILQGAYPIIDLDSFDDTLAGIFGVNLEEAGSQDVAARTTPEAAAQNNTTLSLSKKEADILKACTAQPLRAEELVGALAVSAQQNNESKNQVPDLLEVIRLLSGLELKRKIVRLRDGRYAAKTG
ncbi:MAG: DNA-processing protein DprA [Coriobacteriales bacterium]|jgi:DNA processing protein|nr:DNA-processing protein DprA [Coriobacteriales bacterium]